MKKIILCFLTFFVLIMGHTVQAQADEGKGLQKDYHNHIMKEQSFPFDQCCKNYTPQTNSVIQTCLGEYTQNPIFELKEKQKNKTPYPLLTYFPLKESIKINLFRPPILRKINT